MIKYTGVDVHSQYYLCLITHTYAFDGCIKKINMHFGNATISNINTADIVIPSCTLLYVRGCFVLLNVLVVYECDYIDLKIAGGKVTVWNLLT